MFKHSNFLFAILVAVLIVTFILSCDDNPVSPREEPSLDYATYAFDSTNNLYYEYHPLTGVLDTFICEDNPIWGMEASADGDYLFVATGDYVAKIDLKTKSTVTTLPYRAKYGLAISPDNKYIALAMGPGLIIASVSDFSVEYEENLLDYRSISFSADGKKLYGCYDTSHTVAIVNLENNFSVTTIDLPVSPMRIVKPSLDETKLFLIWQYSKSTNAFVVYDIVLDSIIFREWLYGGYVDLKVAPDGKYLYYTEAGNYADIPGSNYFTIYDIDRKRIYKISTAGIEDGINPIYMAIYPMCLTPDNRWLIIGESPVGKSFLRFNINTMEIDAYIKVNETTHLKYFTCQGN